MALIKSALELAMEKTEGLTVDKEELRRKELVTLGRVAASKAMEEGVDSLETSLQAQEKALSKTEWAVYVGGAADNLLSRIVLAADPGSAAALSRATELLERLTKKKAAAALQKIGGLLKQYGTEFAQLKAAIGQQLGPQLRQRAQQQGANPATYQMEKDPAYLKVLAENLEPLRAEYQQALDQIKAEIRTAL